MGAPPAELDHAFEEQICMSCGKKLGPYVFGPGARRTCRNDVCEADWEAMQIDLGLPVD